MEFVAAGSPPTLSRAIEEYARTHGSLSALVVPWESDRTMLRMSVTSVKTDGWAIEHVNLGTITLTDLGNERTRVAIAAQAADAPDRSQLAAAFDQFARQIHQRLEQS